MLLAKPYFTSTDADLYFPAKSYVPAPHASKHFKPGYWMRGEKSEWT
jgi:hypothetical protein